MDRDIEQLKQIHGRQIAELPQMIKNDTGPGQICNVCKVAKPLSEFYEAVAGSGRRVKECKSCCKARVSAQARAREKISPAISPATADDKSIEQIAPNNAPEAIENQYEEKTANETGHIIARKTNSKMASISRDIQDPATEHHRTCERCGFYGPESKFHLAGTNGHVVLDFAEFPELLENLQADAKRNLRILSNEILFRLITE